MFWRRGNWTPLGEAESSTIVEEYGTHLARMEGQSAGLLAYDVEATAEFGITRDADARRKRLVTSVASRDLSFYSKASGETWYIYRFTCAIETDERDELSGYHPNAAFFAVRAPDGHDGARWTPLDWKSPPVHRLNTAVQLDLAELTPEERLDYLFFFVSFLGGEEESDGLIPPFLITLSQNALYNPTDRADGWCPLPSRDESDDDSSHALADATFEDIARDNRLTLFETENVYGQSDPFDLPRGGDLKRPLLAMPREREKERDAVATFYSDGSAWLTETQEEDKADEADETFFCYTAPLNYGNTLFEADFRVNATRGAVVMDDDRPVEGAERLTSPRWDVRRRRDGIYLLCLQARRKPLTFNQLLSELEKWEKSLSRSGDHVSVQTKPLYLSNRRMLDRVELPRNVECTLIFYDVEFLREVDIADRTFERSVEFRKCRFMRNLILRNATVEGSLVLDGSWIEGATDDRTTFDPNPVIDLSGLRVERLLSLEGIVVHGRLYAAGLRANSAVSARGLQVSERRDVDRPAPERPALDLSQASMDGPLDLSPREGVAHFRRRRLDRTVITGNLSLEGLRAREVKANGIAVGGYFDLDFSQVTGAVSLALYEGKGLVWRALVRGSLHMDRARIGWLFIGGSRIGGDLQMVELTATSIYAVGQAVAGRGASGLYRTEIGGAFDARGAVVENVIQLTGVRITGEILLITGRCGRIACRAYAWWNGGAPILTPVEAGGFVLSSFTIDRTINCPGIKLSEPTSAGAQANWSQGGVVTEGLRVGGAFRFWGRGERSQTREELLSAPGRPQGDNSAAIDTVIAQIQAVIDGPVDLRGARIEGAVNLGRSRVHDKIDMFNVQVGGSLLTLDEACSGDGGLHCKTLNMQNSRIGGNADLRQAEIAGLLDLKGARIEGAVNLGRSRVYAEIDMCNVHVGGNLLSLDKDCVGDGGLHCKNLKMQNSRINGNADLRGVTVEDDGNLEARDLNVAGVLQLAGERKREREWSFYPSITISRGIIDLTGAQASRLILTGQSIKLLPASGDENSDDCVPLQLERARFGQLTIGGFGPSESGNRNRRHFPRLINLTAITVGDWDIEPATEAPALLEASHPFDGRVYVDVETRLARVGESAVANAVYRTMVHRNRQRIWLDQLRNLWAKKLRSPSSTCQVRPAPSPKQQTLLGWLWGVVLAHLSCLNWVFSGNGTVPLLMAFWLILSGVPVAWILSSPANVEPVRTDTVYPNQLDEFWGPQKAIGLAVSYAVPFYGGSRAEVVRARLAQPTCRGHDYSLSDPPAEGVEGAQPKEKVERLKRDVVCSRQLVSWSPHEIAQTVSIIQFILWIILAANLPTIIRRRS